MPELPEVETVRRMIAPVIVGKTVSRAIMGRPCGVFLTPAPELAKRLSGATVRSVERHGKYLILDCAERGEMVVHLGMTGNLYAVANGGTDRHTHMVLELGAGQPMICFRDPRTFGKLQWLEPGTRASNPRLTRLGPDALGISGEGLRAGLRGRKTSVKAVLLDQSVFAGIGNIYADEGLFRSGIRPGRAAERVTGPEADRLAENIRKVLLRAIEKGGSSISDFRHPDGESGYFQIEHLVYGREGEPCRTCGTPIRRKVVAQRSAHYCPKCQR